MPGAGTSRRSSPMFSPRCLLYLLALRLAIGRDVALFAALISASILRISRQSLGSRASLNRFREFSLIGSFLAYLRAGGKTSGAAQMEVNLDCSLCVRALDEGKLVVPSRASAGLRVDSIAWADNPSGTGIPGVVRSGSGQKFGRTLRLSAIYLPVRVHALKGFSHVVRPSPRADDIHLARALSFLVSPLGLAGRAQYLLQFCACHVMQHFKNFIIPALIVGCAGCRPVLRSQEITFCCVFLDLAGAAVNPSSKYPRLQCQRFCA